MRGLNSLKRAVDDSKRITSSWVMCLVALEHSGSMRQLAMCGHYTSAICIIRSQFEALTRAMWLCYTANDSKIENTMKTLSELSLMLYRPQRIRLLQGKFFSL